MRVKTTAALLLGSMLLVQTGCIVVGGYSSDGGFFLWPAGLFISLIVLLVLFLAVRRRSR